jgi:tetratricopeptide (TPR) repeat protein
MANTLAEIETGDAEKVSRASDAISEGDLQTARSLLEEVIANAPSEYVYRYEDGDRVFIKFWDRDEFLQFVAQMPDAEREKKKIVWIASAYPRAYFLLAFIEVEQGNHEEAMRLIEASLRLEPDQTLCLCELGVIYSSLGRYEEAVACYDRAIEARPYAPDSVKAMALRGKGIQLIELGNLELARMCLEASLEYDPSSKLAINELLYIARISSDTLALPVVKFKSEVRSYGCRTCGKEMTVESFGDGGEWNISYTRGNLLFECPECSKNRSIQDAKDLKLRLMDQ